MACLALALAMLAPACASHDEAKTTGAQSPAEVEAPKPKPKPEPVAPEVDVIVASVQLNENCPDPIPSGGVQTAKQRTAKADAMPRDEAAGDSPAGDAPINGPIGLRAACIQSTLQLSIASRTATPVAMEITGVRLFEDGNTAVLSKIEARGPTQWVDGTYKPWDESVPANGSLKASYKLADPDWSAVTKATGKPAWGPTYIVEVDVVLDGGSTQTVRSTPVPREMPEQIQT